MNNGGCDGVVVACYIGFSLLLKNNGISLVESEVPHVNMGAMTYNCFNRKN